MCRERRALLEELACRIAAVEQTHPVRVAIDGVDAAGKTTLADELAGPLQRLGRPVIRGSIDGFHRPAADRRRRGALSPEGYFQDSFNYVALLDVLLLPLGPDGSRHFRRAVFDFRNDQPVEAVLEQAEPDAILLFDGVFLLRPGVREHFDFSIFVRADFMVTTARAEQRDMALFGSVEEVRRRYRERYVPGQRLYLSTAEPEQWATVVMDNNDPLRPAIVAAS
jgi:uridine kinase